VTADDGEVIRLDGRSKAMLRVACGFQQRNTQHAAALCSVAKN